MDHLPYAGDAVLPPIEVPFVCDEDDLYDGLGFRSFPRRKQWSSEQAEWHQCAEDRVAQRAQAWLYFGVLRSILGSAFDLSLFVQRFDDSTPPLITTAYLNTWLTAWKYSVETNRKAFALAQEALAQARIIVGHSDLVDTIVLSLQVLIDSVLMRTKGFGVWDKSSLSWNFVSSLKDRLLASQWCPYWTECYCKKYSSPVLYLLGGMSQHGHEDDHRACTTQQCTANNIDIDSYEPKHVEPGCHCELIGPDIEVVASMIRSGRVPLIQLVEKEPGELQLETVEAALGTQYTAISHVWSGGLGNPHANTLPLCQVRKMQQVLQMASNQALDSVYRGAIKDVLLNDLLKLNVSKVSKWKIFAPKKQKRPPPLCFWLDTFCIPVPPYESSLRMQAINQMAFIYAGARNVTVLDPILRHEQVAEESATVLAARIMSCPWPTRCWTFQEGSLARSLFFALNNDLVTIISDHLSSSLSVTWKRLGGRTAPENSHIIDEVMQQELLAFLQDNPDVINTNVIGDVEDKFHRQSKRLFSVTWNQLSRKTTTKAEDLHGILATLLNLSASEILTLPTYERTKAILRSQPSLPLSMLFISTTHTSVDLRERTWVPPYPSGNVDFKYGSMTWSPDGSGLKVESMSIFTISNSAFLIHTSAPNETRFYFRAEFVKHRNQSHSSDLQALVMVRPRRYARPIEPDFRKYEYSICLLHDYSSLQPHHRRQKGVGACFIVDRRSNETGYHLRYDYPLIYSAEPASSEGDAEILAGDYKHAEASLIPSNVSLTLDCDTAWHNPQYRRPHSTALQRDIDRAVLTFLYYFWIVVLVISCFRLPKAVKDYSGMWRMLNIMFLVVVFWFGRALAYTLFEEDKLVNITRTLKYERFASSFNILSDSTQDAKRMRRAISYQYTPLWTIGIPIGLSFTFLKLPIHGEFLRFVSRFLGWSVLIETFVRLAAELSGRYFGYGARWLDKLSFWMNDDD